MPGRPDAAQTIRDRALGLGFDAVGFAKAELAPETRAGLSEFLSQGLHGDMGWLARNADRRGDPKTLWPEARSVVVVAANYGPAEDPIAAQARLREQNRAAISVYARNRDYHEVLKKRLRTLARWICEALSAEVKLFVDTAPIMEKPLAARAGIGWQGKHTNLVSQDFGSWLFLGEIFTDADLEPDEPGRDRCGSCDRCLAACPTGAFPAPHRLDARRCISYLTIEHRGHIASELRKPMGNRIYGCDDCLAVCPWNKFAEATREPAFLPRVELTAPRLADLAALDDGSFRGLFSGSTIKRIGRDRFVRNVLVAIGNGGDASLTAVVENLLEDDAAIVRAMAVWALSQIAPRDRFVQLRAALNARETDPDVLEEWAAAHEPPRSPALQSA